METARAGGTDTIVIENGLVLPDPGDGTLIEGGTVVIRDGRIAAVGDGRGGAGDGAPTGDGAPAGDGPPAGDATRIDASGCVVMPGLISCHAHCRPFRGLGDGLAMMDWHHSFVHRFSEKMTSEDAYWGAANTFLEMLRNGITTVQVMTSITVVEDSELAAARDSGIRARMIPHVASLPDIEATIARIEAERTAGGDGRVRTWLGFEVPEVMEPSTMRVVADAAERLGAGVHTHFAEYEPGDASRLADAGLLRQGTSLAHCVWLSDDDIAAFAASGTSVSHNPKSNSRYGNGVAPLRKLLDAGVVVGLGTDGPDSTFSCDVFEEARLAAFLARAVGRDPLALGADAALGLATGGGAAALGLEDEIGRLRPGMRADVIVVDLTSPSAAPVLTAGPHRNVAQVLLFGAVGKDVRDVVVDGRVVLRDRRFQTLDTDRAVAETASRAKRILAAM
jgi:5-methylthioadenosine/S-adenosylhomocysteine deaminase